MKRTFLFAAVTIAALISGAITATMAQTEKPTSAPKPAPVIIKATAHTAHFNDFQIRRSKDRSLELEVKKKGLDLAFTEWMQRDHPYVFAAECVKHAGEMATEFKSTNHMVDFDTLLPKRTDLRIAVEKTGHDVAFADWLRRERPNVYRAHFGLDANNKPIKNKKNKAEEQKQKERVKP